MTGDRLKSWEELNNQSLNWLDYQVLLKAIPPMWKTILEEGQSSTEKVCYTCDVLSQCKNVSRKVYDDLIKNNEMLLKYWQRWLGGDLCDLNFHAFKGSFANIQKITKVTKYCDFKYRLLLGQLVFNADLVTWQKIDQDTCTFCGISKETCVHLFLECPVTKEIFNKMSEFWRSRNCQFIVNLENIVLNTFHDNPAHVSNFTGLIAKQFIYKCRCQKMLPLKWQEEIESIHDIELFSSRHNGKLSKHCKYWAPFKPELLRLANETLIEQEYVVNVSCHLNCGRAQQKLCMLIYHELIIN